MLNVGNTVVFLTRITCKDLKKHFYLEKHPDQEWMEMRKDARSTELKSIIMMVMWEQSRGALPFDAMGGIRFRESRWRVTSWPHTWLPAALSLSLRGTPAAALDESPLRCHVCEPPGLHYLLMVHIDLPQRMSPLLCRYGCMGGRSQCCEGAKCLSALPEKSIQFDMWTASKTRLAWTDFHHGSKWEEQVICLSTGNSKSVQH